MNNRLMSQFLAKKRMLSVKVRFRKLRIATLLIQYPRFHVQYIRASVQAKQHKVTFIKHKANVQYKYINVSYRKNSMFSRKKMQICVIFWGFWRPMTWTFDLFNWKLALHLLVPCRWTFIPILILHLFYFRVMSPYDTDGQTSETDEQTDGQDV